MHLSLHRYPLTSYSTWLLSRHASSATASAYVHRVRGVLGSLDCPNDSPEALLAAAARTEDVEVALTKLSQSMQAQARAAWRSFSTFLRETLGGAVQVVSSTGGYRRPGSPVRDARYPLDTFQVWLEANHASHATQVNYSNRVRAVLGALQAPSDRLEDVGLVGGDEARIAEYLDRLSSSTRVQVVSAWRSYATFLETRGVSGICNLAAPRGYRRPDAFKQDRPPEALQLPERVRQAIWHVLAKGHRPMPSDLLLSLTWKSVRYWDGTAPHNATRVDINHNHEMWYYALPVTAWLVLWEWSAGPDRLAPLCDQPVLVAREGAEERLDPSLVLAVAAQGKRGAIPALLAEPPDRWRPWERIKLVDTSAPPVMPPPFAGVPTRPVQGPAPSMPAAEVEEDDDPLAAWDKEPEEE